MHRPLSTPPVEVVWTLVPLQALEILHRCPRCDRERPFLSSEKFRINGNGRRVDVWLIYNCSVCEDSWKLTLFTRVLPSEVGPELYQKLQENDPETALAFGLDRRRLSAAGVRPGEGPLRVDGPGPEELRGLGRVRVHLRWSLPVEIRLDRLLSTQLGLSRAALERHFERGVVSVTPEDLRALRRPARQDQRLLLSCDSIWGSGEEPATEQTTARRA